MPVSPRLPFSKPEYDRVKVEQAGRISISGVQTKHSLKLEGKELSLCDAQGEFILKPVPAGVFLHLEQMPANEHLTMQLASQVFGLDTAENALVNFSGGEPAYLTKRFDRDAGGGKLMQEDFAQIAERTSETHGRDYKYGLSYEEIGSLMKANIGPYPIESEKFFKLVLYNYLVHNGDAHLKNFSIFRHPGIGIHILTPAYDLANTRIHLPNESDTALEMFQGDFETESYRANAYYAKDDFIAFGGKLGIPAERTLQYIDFFLLQGARVNRLIDASFLPKSTQALYSTLVADRLKRLAYSFSAAARPWPEPPGTRPRTGAK